MGAVRSPASQRVPRDSIYAMLSVRLAKSRSQLENGTDFVTDIQGVPDDVRSWGGRGYVAFHILVEEQHHTIAGA
eukprot:gene16616-biopygen3791